MWFEMTIISPSEWRKTLEDRKAEIMAEMPNSDKYTRAVLVKELRRTIGELEDLDLMGAFAQDRETKPSVKIDFKPKVLRQ